MKIPIWACRSALVAGLMMGGASSAWALTIGDPNFVSASSAPNTTAFLGNNENATVTIPWTRTEADATSFTVNIASPVEFVSASSDCSFSTPVLTCTIPAGAIASTGQSSVTIKGGGRLWQL